MHSYLDILAEIAKTGVAREKGRLLKAGDSPILRDILYFAFAPTVTFGVGVVDYDDAVEGLPLGFVKPLDFLCICHQLADRTLRGGAAEVIVRDHINRYPRTYRKLVQAIFAQRLSIGMEAKRINAIFPSLIPTFGVQLAYEYETGRLPFPVYVSSKLDGMRCVGINDQKGCLLWSREGNPITGVPHILKALRALPYGVYDGELMHPTLGFQTTVSICKRENTLHELYEEVFYNLFDRVDISDWEDPKMIAEERFSKLGNIIARTKANDPKTPIKLVQHHLIYNSDALDQWHKHFTAEGFEGTMIQGNIPYSRKRSYGIMKLKDFLSMDAVVLGWEFGAKTSKYKAKMGKLLCQDLKTGVKFKCGSGFVDTDRDVMDGWIGLKIEVKYQNLSDDGKPRFPVYIRTRSDLN